MQLAGEALGRVAALKGVVRSCAAVDGDGALPEAIASWVAEEVEALIVRAWDEGWALGVEHASEVPPYEVSL